MSGAGRAQSWHGRYLWLMLQDMGFSGEPGKSGVGANMFDKPNRDAFYVVAHFLFSHLDHSRCKETFRYCWPPLDKKRDAEFRKLCCEWLRSISDECGRDFPQVVASLFLSPGGPKFTLLMFHFARYVMLQRIKLDAYDETIFQSLNSKPKDLHIAFARNKVARNRFLRITQQEDFVIQQYQKKSQKMVKQIRDLRSEIATLQTELHKFEEKDAQRQNTTLNVQRVRSMWASVMETLSFLEKEKEVVDSVIKGHVDQYTLDGTDVSVNVPRLLVDKIENDIDKLQMGNVYEAGKLNLTALVQLLNESLKILMQEHRQVTHRGLKLDLQYIEGKTAFENEVLSRLRDIRHKIRREYLVSVKKSIAAKQSAWDLKWEQHLGQSPFHAIKDLNPALDLESMAAFSFTPAHEDALKRSVYCRYPPSRSDSPKKDLQAKGPSRGAVGLSLRSNVDSTPTGSESTQVSAAVTRPRISAHVPDFLQNEIRFEVGYCRTVSLAQLPTSLTPSKSARRQSEKDKQGATPKRAPLGVNKTRPEGAQITEASHGILQTPTLYRHEDTLKQAWQQLADQVADEIVAESQKTTSGRGMELEDIIGILSTNPFLTKKQIPRTPENLISDIRTSWRKAIQTEDLSDLQEEHIESEALSKESSNELISLHNSQMDSSMACFLSASQLSAPNDDSGEKNPLDWSESAPCKSTAGQANESVFEMAPRLPNKACQTFETDFPFATEGLTEYGATQGLTEYGPTEHTFPLVHLAHVPDSNSHLANNTMLKFLNQENVSAHTTLSWDSSRVLGSSDGSDSQEVIQFGILHETLPEINISLNSSKSLETDEGIENEDKGPDGDLDTRHQKWVKQQRRLDLQAISSRFEALKSTMKKNAREVEDLYLSPARKFVKQRSESCLYAAEKKESFCPAESLLTLDFDCLESPPRVSLDERKPTLPQLTAFSPFDEPFMLEIEGEMERSKAFDDDLSPSDLERCTDEAVGQLIDI